MAGEEGTVVPWARGSAAQEFRPGGSHGPPGNPQTKGPLGQADLLSYCMELELCLLWIQSLNELRLLLFVTLLANHYSHFSGIKKRGEKELKKNLNGLYCSNFGGLE